MSEEERRVEELVRCVAIAQAVGRVRSLVRLHAPQCLQMQAMACLARKLAPYAKPGEVGVLCTMLLTVADVQDQDRKGTTQPTPNTIQELEALYKEQDGNH